MPRDYLGGDHVLPHAAVTFGSPPEGPSSKDTGHLHSVWTGSWPWLLHVSQRLKIARHSFWLDVEDRRWPRLPCRGTPSHQINGVEKAMGGSGFPRCGMKPLCHGECSWHVPTYWVTGQWVLGSRGELAKARGPEHPSPWKRRGSAGSLDHL